MRLRSLAVVTVLLLVVPPHAAAQHAPAAADRSPGPARRVLRIDPRLIVEAAEAWTVIAAPENPVWPGWNASDTPILFYLPGEQDVLINHPRPPAGFVEYDGPVRFPAGRILVRDGSTILQADGQNTSRDIEGVPTLVVADALSNLRQRVRGLLEDPRDQAEKVRGLGFSELATDPYDQLALIVHEAFHVFQGRAAPDKSANEMLLLSYPVLSIENNVGFAQEGAALAAALRADSGPALRAAVVRWLAVRRQRRSALPPEAIEYEDGAEFGEGLAKYVEYRLLQVFEGRTPGPEMWWCQGFAGYGDLAPRRAELVHQMLQHMRGEVAVNNDPYGTAPLRMRLYYSGMAIGAVLDRLTPAWKDRIVQPGVSLTRLVEAAVGAGTDELRGQLEEARREEGYEALVDAKTRLAREGRARIDTMLARIEHGPGLGIVVEYGALQSPRVALAFTPFGITAVDRDRAIYAQVPIRARFPDGSEVAETEPLPLLHDRGRRLIRFRLPRELAADELARAAGGLTDAPREVRGLRLELPGAVVSAPSATIRLDGRDLRVVLRPSR